jgi:hypothetical protein
MKGVSNHMPAFLKSSFQKLQYKREHWNAALQKSLQELDDPKYEKIGQVVAFIFVRFFLFQVRLVIGVILFLMSTIFFRGALESIQYLPLGLLFFFCVSGVAFYRFSIQALARVVFEFSFQKLHAQVVFAVGVSLYGLS